MHGQKPRLGRHGLTNRRRSSMEFEISRGPREGTRIRCAALLMSDGEIYTGRTHSRAIYAAITGGQPDMLQAEEGFLTDDRQFVTREEAGRLALACGQVTRLLLPDKGLTSQDLRR
jgi:hypothetical protein